MENKNLKMNKKKLIKNCLDVLHLTSYLFMIFGLLILIYGAYENKMIIKNFCEDQGWIVHNDNSCQRYFNNITVVVKEVVVINKTAYWIN